MIEFVLAFFVILILWNVAKKPAQYPPGPWGLPLIGYIPLGLNHFQEKVKELQEKHYPIFSWRLGTQFLVFISDYKLAKEAFQSHLFANRPAASFVNIFEDTGEGITTGNGIYWQTIRRFTLRHLKDLGLGKSKIALAIQCEANELVKVMVKQAGTSAPVPVELSTALINIMSEMLAGTRHELNDVEIISMDKDMHDFEEHFGSIVIRHLFPWLDSVIPESVMNYITKKKIRLGLEKRITKRFEEGIDEHIATFDENNPRDFIDDYLIEMEKQKGDLDSMMTRRNLLGCLADLFQAGLATTNITLHWSIFHLAKYQDIQKELQNEIDDVLPNEISPTWEDKSRMPKVEAFITEILRYTSLVQFGIPRTVESDTKFAGYVIPKGAVVMVCEKFIHFNNEFYKSAERFNPHRFLDSSGKFESPKEGFLAFGIGKRQCLGESLARMELFMFLVTMLQHVEFHPPPNKEININPLEIPYLTLPHAKQNILIKTRSSS